MKSCLSYVIKIHSQISFVTGLHPVHSSDIEKVSLPFFAFYIYAIVLINVLHKQINMF